MMKYSKLEDSQVNYLDISGENLNDVFRLHVAFSALNYQNLNKFTLESYYKSYINFIIFIPMFREEDLVTKLDLKSEEQFPKVVMAPDAAKYYEKVELEKAIAESQRAASLAGL